MGNAIKKSTKFDDALSLIRNTPLKNVDSKLLSKILNDIDDTAHDIIGKATLKREVLVQSGFSNFDNKGTLADVIGFKDLKIEVVELTEPITLFRRGYSGEPSSPYGLGRWWGDKNRSIEEVRNELAVCEKWGNPLNGEYKITVPKGTKVLKGLAAPQTIRNAAGEVIETRSGGGVQFWLNDVSDSWLN